MRLCCLRSEWSVQIMLPALRMVCPNYVACAQNGLSKLCCLRSEWSVQIMLPALRMVCQNALFFPFKCRNFVKKCNFLEWVRYIGVENCDRRGTVGLFVLRCPFCQWTVLKCISLKIASLLSWSCFPPHKINKVDGPLCLFKTWTSVLYPIPCIRTKLYQKDKAPCH